MTDHRLLPRADGPPRKRNVKSGRAEVDALRLELAAARAELTRRESFMAAVLETIDVGIVFCGAEGTDWTRNRAGRALLGLDDGAGSLGPEGAAPLTDIFDAVGDKVAVVDYPILRALRGEDVGAVELLLGPLGGPHREVVSLNTRIVDAQGAVLGAVSALTDVTSERSANRALAGQRQAASDAHTFLTAVLTASPDYTFISALPSGGLVYGSPGKNVLGLTTDELEAMGSQLIATLVHPEDAQKLRDVNVAAAGMADGTVLQVRYRGRHTDGQWHWLSRRVTPFKRDGAGQVVEILGVLRDVTDAVAVEDQLTHASLHDSLTGLPNRTLLMDRLQGALHRAARHGSEVTVLFCDLDGFKRVNDTAGHAAGDAVLQETGRRITSAVRVGDTVSRIGGDEFVVLIEPRTKRPEGGGDAVDLAGDLPEEVSTAFSTDDRAADRALGGRIAARVAAAVRRPIIYGGVELHVTASIGMTFAGGRLDSEGAGITPETVLKRADDLMYQAKAHGKDRVEVHAPAP